MWKCDQSSEWHNLAGCIFVVNTFLSVRWHVYCSLRRCTRWFQCLTNSKKHLCCAMIFWHFSCVFVTCNQTLFTSIQARVHESETSKPQYMCSHIDLSRNEHLSAVHNIFSSLLGILTHTHAHISLVYARIHTCSPLSVCGSVHSLYVTLVSHGSLIVALFVDHMHTKFMWITLRWK